MQMVCRLLTSFLTNYHHLDMEEHYRNQVAAAITSDGTPDPHLHAATCSCP